MVKTGSARKAGDKYTVAGRLYLLLTGSDALCVGVPGYMLWMCLVDPGGIHESLVL